MSISIDLKSNKRLMSYYQSNDIGNSFKSIIHVVLKIQLPDKIWDLIKEFPIMNEEQLNWCRDANRYGAAIRNGVIISFPYYNKIFNNRHLPMRSLRLEYNEIYNIDALANALKTNNTIQTLRLEGNKISDLTSLGEALKVNTNLRELSIWGNQISNIDPIAEALKTNTTLKELNIKGNQISNIDPIAEALKTNTTLKDLNIKGNQISKVDVLIEALKINTTLTRLHFIKIPDFC